MEPITFTLNADESSLVRSLLTSPDGPELRPTTKELWRRFTDAGGAVSDDYRSFTIGSAAAHANLIGWLERASDDLSDVHDGLWSGHFGQHRLDAIAERLSDNNEAGDPVMNDNTPNTEVDHSVEQWRGSQVVEPDPMALETWLTFSEPETTSNVAISAMVPQLHQMVTEYLSLHARLTDTDKSPGARKVLSDWARQLETDDKLNETVRAELDRITERFLSDLIGLCDLMPQAAALFADLKKQLPSAVKEVADTTVIGAMHSGDENDGELEPIDREEGRLKLQELKDKAGSVLEACKSLAPAGETFPGLPLKSTPRNPDVTMLALPNVPKKVEKVSKANESDLTIAYRPVSTGRWGEWVQTDLGPAEALKLIAKNVESFPNAATTADLMRVVSEQGGTMTNFIVTWHGVELQSKVSRKA